MILCMMNVFHCVIDVPMLSIQENSILSNILEALSGKKSLQKLFNRRPITYGVEFRNCRNHAIKSAKRNFYFDCLSSNERSLQKMCTVINEMQGSKTNKNCVIKQLNSPNGVVTSLDSRHS